MSAADDAIQAAKDPTRTWEKQMSERRGDLDKFDGSYTDRCPTCGGTKEEPELVAYFLGAPWNYYQHIGSVLGGEVDVRYRTIVADPPWPMTPNELRSRPWAGVGGRRRRATSFPYPTFEEIAALPVANFAEDESHLYLGCEPQALSEYAREWLPRGPV